MGKDRTRNKTGQKEKISLIKELNVNKLKLYNFIHFIRMEVEENKDILHIIKEIEIKGQHKDIFRYFSVIGIVAFLSEMGEIEYSNILDNLVRGMT